MKPRAGTAAAAPAPSYSQHKNYLLSYLYGVKPPRPLFHFHSVSPFGHFPLLCFSSSPLLLFSCPFTSIYSSIWPFPLHLSFVPLPSHFPLPTHFPLPSQCPSSGRWPGIWELVGPGFYRPDMVETCDGRGAADGYAFPTFGPMLTTVWSSSAWVPGISILPMAFS